MPATRKPVTTSAIWIRLTYKPSRDMRIANPAYPGPSGVGTTLKRTRAGSRPIPRAADMANSGLSEPAGVEFQLRLGENGEDHAVEALGVAVEPGGNGREGDVAGRLRREAEDAGGDAAEGK